MGVEPQVYEILCFLSTQTCDVQMKSRPGDFDLFPFAILYRLWCVLDAGHSSGMVDVKNKRCEAPSCMKRGLFGFDGEKARFCGGHRLKGERILRPRSRQSPCICRLNSTAMESLYLFFSSIRVFLHHSLSRIHSFMQPTRSGSLLWHDLQWSSCCDILR